MTLARIAVLVVAVPVLAWLAVSYSNSRVIRHAQVVAAAPHPAPGDIDATLADLRGSDPLDPSRTERLSYEGALEIRAGRLDAARAIYERIARLEPDVPETWVVLAALTRTSDPARSAQAEAQVRRLDPLSAKRR